MSADIAARLRSAGRGASPDLLDDAAAEIDRLRGLLSRIAHGDFSLSAEDEDEYCVYMSDTFWGLLLLEFKDGIPHDEIGRAS